MILKKKIYLSLSIFAVIILFFSVFVVYRLFSEIKKQSQDFIKQKNYYLELQARNDNFQELVKFKDERQNELTKINSLFVEADPPLDFNNFLRETAQNADLQITINDIKLGKPEVKQWNFLNYQITLIGSFNNLTRFLDQLENSPYLIEVNNLNIKESTGQSSLSDDSIASIKDIKAEIAVKVYTK